MYNYFLVILATLFFSLQFLFQQKYQESCGTELPAALNFNIYKGIAVLIMMLSLCGFKPQFTLFSLILSGIYTVCYILVLYFSLKAFSVANLSVFSVFIMLGGMIIPFIVGVSLFDEEINIFKIICCLLVAIASLLNIKKGGGNKKAIKYYLLIFLLNGSIAAISTIHQKVNIPHTDSTSFMLYSGIWSVVICSVWLIIKGEKIQLLKRENLVYSFGNGILNGLGDLFLLITVVPGALDASVQYPFVTGGVIIFSTVISTLRKEKVRLPEYISAVVAFIASVMMAF